MNVIWSLLLNKYLQDVHFKLGSELPYALSFPSGEIWVSQFALPHVLFLQNELEAYSRKV